MYSKKTIVDILVRRDELSEKEAQDLVEDVQKQIDDALEIGDSDEVETILQEELGLEPDYLYAFLD